MNTLRSCGGRAGFSWALGKSGPVGNVHVPKVTMTVLNKCWGLEAAQSVCVCGRDDDCDDRATSGCGLFLSPRRKKKKSGFEDTVCTLKHR